MRRELDAERARLEAVLVRHGPGMPPRAWAAIGAAADELHDPQTRPAISAAAAPTGSVDRWCWCGRRGGG